MLLFASSAFGWSSKTHLYIAKEAGLKYPEAACFPDLVKEENIALNAPFHWHDAAPKTIVTPEYIDNYKTREGMYIEAGAKFPSIKINVPAPSGVLYWKIIALYLKMLDARGWEHDYYLSNIAHYVTDLSQPLHNFPYGNLQANDGTVYPAEGQWSKEHGKEFDGVIDPYLPLSKEDLRYLRAKITDVQIKSADGLKAEIAKIANASIALANRCFAEKRAMTKEEALKQLAMSVSLLRALPVR